MLKKLALLFLGTVHLGLYGGDFSRYTIDPEHIMIKKVTVLDAISVHFWNFDEISDLAYDPVRDLLYAVSDSAWLYTLEMKLQNDHIATFKLLHRRKLKGKDNTPLTRKKLSDAEGMCYIGGNLFVSFERRPRIVLYTTKGEYLYSLKLPKPLHKKRLYRGKNQMLEALTYHPLYHVITAPEDPLRTMPQNRHALYSKKTRWYFEAAGSITALETTPKGNILVLERTISASDEFILTLSLLDPSGCENALCRTKKLLQLSSDANFEGLTRLTDNRYLLSSDSRGLFFRSDTRFILIQFDD